MGDQQVSIRVSRWDEGDPAWVAALQRAAAEDAAQGHSTYVNVLPQSYPGEEYSPNTWNGEHMIGEPDLKRLKLGHSLFLAATSRSAEAGGLDPTYYRARELYEQAARGLLVATVETRIEQIRDL